MSKKEQTYIIAITIIEGRHYIWDNMNSAVIVKVGNKRKCTPCQKKSDNPFYNEYYTFEMTCTHEKFLENNITLTVIRPKSFCRKRKILGITKLDVETVLNQKNSQFYHKWAGLISPKPDTVSGPTGFLKVDICVLTRGQTPKLPLNVFNDEIEGNLLTSFGKVSERQRAKFVFDIYHCEHFTIKTNQFTDLELPDLKPSICVKITFAGTTVSTALKKRTQTPIFNEKLTITDMFPPLCQRIKIEIVINSKKFMQTVEYLRLKQISNDAVHGFPPTFGPAYVYFYSKDGYAGRLLMAVRTEFLSDTVKDLSAGTKSQVVERGIRPLVEESVFRPEEVFLFATIFEANCINKKYSDKLLSFRITFGNITYQTGESLQAKNVTVGRISLKTKKFHYLNYGQEKPCISINSVWPDFRKRMFHSNMLEKIARNLKFRLEEIKYLFLNTSQNIGDKLSEASEYLLTSIQTYLDILKTSFVFDYGSILDQERIKQCNTSMQEILNKLLILQTNKSKRVVYRYLEDFQDTIQSLVEDVQPCWPDVYLWVTAVNKKLGHLRIPARKIVFSSIEEAIGDDCGKVIPMLFLIEGKSDIICKIEVLLWLGLENERDKFLEMLPKGFKYEDGMLKAVESHIFESNAYIFGGSLDPGFDASGLADPFIQCSLGPQMKETLIKWSVCVPIWDQTLAFHNLVFYGAKEHLKEYPPTFLVQMFDKDPMSIEFVGRKLIKPVIIFLDDPDQPTKLNYHELPNNGDTSGRILAAFRLTEIHSVTKELKEKKTAIPIPDHIKPIMEPYRIEVAFWGVRNLKKVHLIRINRPKVIFYFENINIASPVIDNARKFSNFTNNICTLDVNIPNQYEYPGMVWLKLFDSRKFGVYVYCGISLGETTTFLLKLMTKDERTSLITGLNSQSTISPLGHQSSLIEVVQVKVEPETLSLSPAKPEKVKKPCWPWLLCKKYLRLVLGFKAVVEKPKKSKSNYTLLVEEVEKEEDESDYDWWTKFYASVEKGHDNQNSDTLQTLKIYPSELEYQPEFNGFSDMLTTFEIFKGKQTGDEVVDEQFVTAIFKGSIKFYKWPQEDEDIDQYVTPYGNLLKDGVFSNMSANTNLNYVLRIYCVRGINLRPKDLNGKSDPYVEIKLGDQFLSDRENYIPRDINPVFGRCFEFNCSFPQTTSVTIRVKDFDLTSADDLIGETKIDLENRFYTKHMANCGIPECYRIKGYCKWRDQRKPSTILSKLCKSWGLEDPVYQENSVSINLKEFYPKSCDPDPEINKEVLALEALRHWQQMPLVGFQIVPEYVETRSLFTPDKPGLEQGKLQLWIDIFPKLDYPVTPKVDITPRKPVSYELRVIIWNTEDVVLQEDDLFTGEKKSDIYVKGWLHDSAHTQNTDVHYRSLTGEGNFNWRFIFKFDYLATENKMVIKKKDSLFARDETTRKVPCILNLSVWDNDSFSADDFMGSVELELSKMPRGASSSKLCTMDVMKTSAKNKINLFKTGRTRGWWPFLARFEKGGDLEIGGKLEAELEVVTADDALKHIVGQGRQGPEALPPPNRPDTSYSWFRNPLKSCKYVVCNRWRRQLCCTCFIILLVIFVALAVYSLPGAVVQEMLAAIF